MHLKSANLMFGALLATSLGILGTPAHATTSSAVAAYNQAERHYIVVAGGVGDKAQGKVNEMNDAASGAANAVEEKHEEHEMSESTSRHRSLKHKAKSKMHEVKDEANGAADAVEDSHERHEEAEHE